MLNGRMARRYALPIITRSLVFFLTLASGVVSAAPLTDAQREQIRQEFQLTDFEEIQLTLDDNVKTVDTIVDIFGARRKLVLEPTKRHADDFQILLLDGTGMREADIAQVRTFRGSFEGLPGSYVSVVLDNDDYLYAHIVKDVGSPTLDVYYLQSVPSKIGAGEAYVLYHESDVVTEERFVCGTDDDEHHHSATAGMLANTPPPSTLASAQPQAIEMAIEADYYFYLQEGQDPVDIYRNIMSVVTGTSAVYELQFNTDVVVTKLLIQITAQANPYPNTQFSNIYLDAVRTYWELAYPRWIFDRDVMHLFSKLGYLERPTKPSPIWGLGYRPGVCDDYGYSLIASAPLNSVMTQVMTHELGHNLNVQHCDSNTLPAAQCGVMGAPNKGVRQFGTVSLPVVKNYMGSVSCLSDGYSSIASLPFNDSFEPGPSTSRWGVTYNMTPRLDPYRATGNSVELAIGSYTTANASKFPIAELRSNVIDLGTAENLLFSYSIAYDIGNAGSSNYLYVEFKNSFGNWQKLNTVRTLPTNAGRFVHYSHLLTEDQTGHPDFQIRFITSLLSPSFQLSWYIDDVSLTDALVGNQEIFNSSPYMAGVGVAEWGLDVEVLGDGNRDGKKEFAVVSKLQDGSGLVEVWQEGIDPRRSGPIAWIRGRNPNDGFGVIANIGDIDGDGFDDFAIGAPFVDPTPSLPDAGRVYVYSGNFTNLGGSPPYAPRLIGSFSGLNGCDTFGYSLSAVGDINGDGSNELLVGAPMVGTNANCTLSGSVVVYETIIYSNKGGGRLGVSRRKKSRNNRYRFGIAFAGAADIDGDGVTDYARADHYTGSTGDFVDVAVISGSSGGGLAVQTFLFNQPVSQGEIDLQYYGISRDGFPMFLLGVSAARRVGAPSGSTNQDGEVYALEYTGSQAIRYRRIRGGVAGNTNGGDRAGTRVRVLGDIDQDGYPEVAISAPNGVNGIGTVEVHSIGSLSSSVVHNYVGWGRFTNPGDGMAVGDLDGDGSTSLLITSRNYGQYAIPPGQVTVFSDFDLMRRDQSIWQPWAPGEKTEQGLQPRLTGYGKLPLVYGDSFHLALDQFPPNQLVFVLVKARTSLPVPINWYWGTSFPQLWVPPTFPVPVMTDANGQAEIITPLTWNEVNQINNTLELQFQAVFIDPNATMWSRAVVTSNTLRMTPP